MTVQPHPYPIKFCVLCEHVERVNPDGRGFPPDIAERKLRKSCKERGCSCEPDYFAGVVLGPRWEDR